MKVVVNTDQSVVEEVRKQLKQNEGYCPCKLEHIPENKCMCKEFIDNVTTGYCHCGLYQKVEV